jgi:hypothetical protein
MTYYAMTYYGSVWLNTMIMADTERETLKEAEAAAYKSSDYAPNLIIWIVTRSGQDCYGQSFFKNHKTIQHVAKEKRFDDLNKVKSECIYTQWGYEPFWEAIKELIAVDGDIGNIGNDVIELVKQARQTQLAKEEKEQEDKKTKALLEGKRKVLSLRKRLKEAERDLLILQN